MALFIQGEGRGQAVEPQPSRRHADYGLETQDLRHPSLRALRSERYSREESPQRQSMYPPASYRFPGGSARYATIGLSIQQPKNYGNFHQQHHATCV